MQTANYRTMPNLIATMAPFKHGSHHANSDGETYEIYSYSTRIATYDYATGVITFNERKYSMTTSRLQNIIRRAWGL
jgi:hypothetical protein